MNAMVEFDFARTMENSQMRLSGSHLEIKSDSTAAEKLVRQPKDGAVP